MLADAEFFEPQTVTEAAQRAEHPQGWVSGTSASLAVTPPGFTCAIKLLVAQENKQERASRGRAGREHILGSFATCTPHGQTNDSLTCNIDDQLTLVLKREYLSGLAC